MEDLIDPLIQAESQDVEHKLYQVHQVSSHTSSIHQQTHFKIFPLNPTQKVLIISNNCYCI